MFASLVNNLLKNHVMHDWTEIDCYRYCDCGILEQCDGIAVTDSEVKWEDVSNDRKAILDFKLLTGRTDINLN
jgi:hypothetical protein